MVEAKPALEWNDAPIAASSEVSVAHLNLKVWADDNERVGRWSIHVHGYAIEAGVSGTVYDAKFAAESAALKLLSEGVVALGGRVLDAGESTRLKYDPCEVCAGSGKLLTVEPCGICKGTGSGAEEKVGLRLECHRLSQPAHVLAEAERLLREARVSRVAFSRRRGLNVTIEQFAVCDPAGFPTTSGDTLALAYAKLTGGRNG